MRNVKEIKCPNCGQVFQVDESGYAQIVQQVRDQEFNAELSRREKELSEKSETERKLAISEAVQKTEKESDRVLSEAKSQLAEKEQLIAQLKAQVSGAETEKKLAVSEALQEKEKELSEQRNQITELKGQLSNAENESELKEKTLKEQYEFKLKEKDELIEYYKDFKARQSTKMIGESLEQHCLTQFNSIRMTAFPTAYFEKDNDAKSGSKGDFIFKDTDEDGIEYISIMFEMKNEADTTATKHKNEDFFKELDKDRREKKCEYAVLVSMLESDSELYNQGIVDVSYRYPKMYVIRPQYFIPMITLLRNAARNSLEYQKELAIVRNQQVDIMNFEANMNAFKEGFAKNYETASKKFQTAIEEIDKTIDHLNKVKDALTSSERQLRLANDKADDLTIKKLTKNAPSVKAMFDELEKDSE